MTRGQGSLTSWSAVCCLLQICALNCCSCFPSLICPSNLLKQSMISPVSFLSEFALLRVNHTDWVLNVEGVFDSYSTPHIVVMYSSFPPFPPIFGEFSCRSTVLTSFLSSSPQPPFNFSLLPTFPLKFMTSPSELWLVYMCTQTITGSFSVLLGSVFVLMMFYLLV